MIITKKELEDGHWHDIVVLSSSGRSEVIVDGHEVDIEVRRQMLGDAVVDAELIPPKLWKSAVT